MVILICYLRSCQLVFRWDFSGIATDEFEKKNIVLGIRFTYVKLMPGFMSEAEKCDGSMRRHLIWKVRGRYTIRGWLGYEIQPWNNDALATAIRIVSLTCCLDY